MRSTIVAIAAASVLASSCGGGGESSLAEVDPTAPATAVASASPSPAATTDEAPAEIALVDAELLIGGETQVSVSPGEQLTVEHLVHNQADRNRSLGLRVQQGQDPVDVELSQTSVRAGGGEVLPITSSVIVPDDAVAGQAIVFDVVVVDVDDITRRSVTTVQLDVTEAGGSRPAAADDRGTTTTNERVIVYVVGNDTDPDGDLDYGSVRVVGGGFYAAEVTGAADGTITYVPFADVTGADIVLYEICDREQRCDAAAVTVTVEP